MSAPIAEGWTVQNKEIAPVLELVVLLRKSHGRLNKRFLPLLKAHNFTPTEILVLLKVIKDGFFRPTELARAGGIPASTFTGIVDRLVDRGLLQRETDPKNRRSIVVKGTPALYIKAREVQGELETELAKLFEPVPPELLLQTLEGLRQIDAMLFENNPKDDPEGVTTCE